MRVVGFMDEGYQILFVIYLSGCMMWGLGFGMLGIGFRVEGSTVPRRARI